MTELTCYRTVCTNERLRPSQIGTLVTVIVVVDECETVQAPRKHTLAINPTTAAAIVLLSISTTLLEGWTLKWPQHLRVASDYVKEPC